MKKTAFLILFLISCCRLCIGQVTPKIVAGLNTTLVLRADGSIWNCGTNVVGEMGNGTLIRQDNLTRLGTKTYTDVASGSSHSLAIASDGTVWAWGWNFFGQLGNGTSLANVNDGVTTPVQAGIGTYKKVAAGTTHSMAIKTDGTLWIWGGNDSGQLGLGLGNNLQKSPIQLGTDTYTSISAWERNSFAIKSNGTLWAWGPNSFGQLGNGTTIGSNVPVQIGTENDWRQVYGSSFGVFALKNDGTLWASGPNDYGGLGNGTTIPSPGMTQIGIEKYTSIYMASGTCLTIRTDGTLWAWGANQLGQVGDGTTIHRLSPVRVGTGKYIGIATSSSHSLAISENGTVYSWGSNLGGGLGIGSTDRKLAPTQVGTSTYNAIAAGANHGVAIKSDGTLWTWGDNRFWQLGDNVGEYRSAPGQISTGSFSKISAGSLHSMALKSNGTIYSWGNFAGQFPNQIGSDNYSEIAAGNGYSMALKEDGTLWTWGTNLNGQLGNGTTSNQTSPAKVGTAVYTKIAGNCNSSVSLALRSDGSVWGWGINDGLFKEGTDPFVTTPTLRQSGFAYQDLAPGNGLRVNGSIWAGGYILGTYPVQFYNAPTQITTGPFTAIAQGGDHALAIKSDGTLWAWGDNVQGELGNGDVTNASQLTPVQIGTATYKAVACGNGFSIALRTDGTLWTWGKNWNSELGLGFNSFETLPQPLINVYNRTNPLVNWFAPLEITYGQPLGADQLSAEAAVPGTFTYHPPAGTILDAGTNLVLSVDFLPSDVTQYYEVNNTEVHITVNKASQVITFPSVPIKTLSDASFSLNASSSAGLPIVYGSSNLFRAKVEGNTVTLVSAGSVTINASQEGNANINRAISVEHTFCINPAKPVITQAPAPGNSAFQELTSSNAVGNQWFLDGVPIAGAVNSTLTVNTPGSYTVISTVDECASQVSDAVPVVITGLIDGEGVDVIYPNPSQDRIYLSLENFEMTQTIVVSVSDMLGRTIDTFESLGNATERIDISTFQTGQYIVEAKQSTRLYVGKFIKK